MAATGPCTHGRLQYLRHRDCHQARVFRMNTEEMLLELWWSLRYLQLAVMLTHGKPLALRLFEKLMFS
jgi:hypothetical protein